MFWADAKMIADYNFFGDVVSFDTTYQQIKNTDFLLLFIGEWWFLVLLYCTTKQLIHLNSYLEHFLENFKNSSDGIGYGNHQSNLCNDPIFVGIEKINFDIEFIKSSHPKILTEQLRGGWGIKKIRILIIKLKINFSN